jgi:ABC-2 type transport system permease protein
LGRRDSQSPLAALSVGQGDLYPAYTKVSLWNNRHDLFTEVENENPLHLLNGRFDLAFVVIYLYPLFILGLTYNLVSGEREAGTLPLLASQPVSLKTIALRRLGLLLIVLFLPIAALSAAGVLAGRGALGSEGWMALGLWMLVAAAYGAFWFALALAVNSRGWNSATNATVAATAWLALVLIVPSVLNLAVTTMAPVPSRSEYVQALRAAANESEDAGKVLLARYYDEHPDLRPAADGKGPKKVVVAYWLGMWNTARQMEPVLDRYEGALARQHALAGSVRYLSPAAVALEIMNDLSGTGANRYMRFRAETAQFQREWHAFFSPRMFGGLRMTAGDYDHVPRFHMPDDSIGYRLTRTLMALAGLLLPTLAMLAYAVRRLAQTTLSQ